MIYFETQEDGMVSYIHWMPFDTMYGLGQTEEELLTSGHLVESVPEYGQPVPDNMKARLYYKDGEFSWKLVEVTPPLDQPTYEELLTMYSAIERGLTT